MTFRSLGEMNNHKVEQHLQKGDIPQEEKNDFDGNIVRPWAAGNKKL